MSAVTQTTFDDYDDSATGFDVSDQCKTSARWRLYNKCRRSARQWYWSEYDRADYECPVCGVHSSDTTMHVHHRDGEPLNNHPLNLVAVCARCHRLEHRRRHAVRRVQSWKADYSDLFTDDATSEDMAVIDL